MLKSIVYFIVLMIFVMPFFFLIIINDTIKKIALDSKDRYKDAKNVTIDSLNSIICYK